MGDDVPVSYTRAVGQRLRDLRHQRGLSLIAVEERSGREFKASVLGAYERGERVISVLRLQRLAQIYRVPVDQILPRGPGLDGGGDGHTDGARRFSARRPVRIDLAKLVDTDSVEAQVVRRYVNMIQRQRSDFRDRTLAIRDEDLRALGRFFERDDTAMEMKLAELGLSY